LSHAPRTGRDDCAADSNGRIAGRRRVIGRIGMTAVVSSQTSGTFADLHLFIRTPRVQKVIAWQITP